MSDENTKMTPLVGEKQRDEAAVKLQKTYKCFRTRRRLADCAILVEQRWREVLASVEVKHSSISFFDIHKPQIAISVGREVGKGLSEDEKACKLALQHWLKEVSTLLPQSLHNNVINSHFCGIFYIYFHYSETSLEGNLFDIRNATLHLMWLSGHSGRYLPTREIFYEFMTYLEQHNINVNILQKFPSNGEDASFARKDRGFGLRNSLSTPNFSQATNEESNVKCSDNI
ncbi:hypothetical protein CQW23_02949 [Capsicum baccatum]|uniref:Uncharacterized protein n=1 Tax=Capsicum baccatum TaxID=33114 RepID=A0A2G2XSW3_CAPBA|nr:hypothetical protein CQW23_02949 [Capsicum baccatum]